MGLIIHVDGGARGNPGPAGAGVVIASEDGTYRFEAGYFLGRQTNNAAEYHALIRALQRTQERANAGQITIYSDSELLVRQITGEYQVKSPKLAQLHEQVQLLLLRLPRWNIRHVRRDQNRRADELANLAMDRQADVLVADGDPSTAPAATSDSPAPEAGVPRPMESGENLAAVRIGLTRPSRSCPAGGPPAQPFTVTHALPVGLCVHAAHAILPSLLAILNTPAEERAGIPTLTVRCGHERCGAEFQLTPVPGGNGRHS